MTVYVDNVRIPHRGERWCHMVADSLAELHAFARQLGIPARGFHHEASYPHYDIPVAYRQRALAAGALPGDRRQIIHCARKLKAEYLRQEREKGGKK